MGVARWKEWRLRFYGPVEGRMKEIAVQVMWKTSRTKKWPGYSAVIRVWMESTTTLEIMK
jgi:hypothetical protein